MKPIFFPCLLACALIFPASSEAETFYWDGATGGGWDQNTNWATTLEGGTDPAGVPGAGDTAVFSVTGLTGARAVNLNGNRQVAGLEFNNADTVTLQAGGTNRILELGAGGIIAGAATKTVNIGSTTTNQNVSISLMAAQAWTYNSTAASPVNGWGIYVRNAVSLGISGTHTLTLGGTISSTNPLSAVSGAVSDGAGTLNIEMSGNNNLRWTLSGDNSYTGTTVVKNGGLTIGHVNALGSTSTGTTVESGASIFLRSTIGSIAAEALTISGSGSGSSGALRNVNGVNTWNGAITLAGSTYIGADSGAGSIFTLSETATISRSGAGDRIATFMGGGTIEVQGTISGDIAVTRGVNGTLLMTGAAKAYTGATNISANGHMILNTSLSGTSQVTVNGNLRGNGGSIRTGAAVSVTGTGVLAPGTSSTVQDIGILSMGALSLQNLSTMALDIHSGDLTSDVVEVTSLNLTNGAVLTVNDLGSSTIGIGEALLFIKNSGAWNGGFFTVNGTLIGDESTTFAAGANTFQIDYDYSGGLGTGVALISVVPEPTAPALLSLAALAMVFRRRK